MLHIRLEADDNFLATRINDSEIDISNHQDAATLAAPHEQTLYKLTKNNLALCLFPFLDAGGKAISLVMDLNSTKTSIGLTSVAGITQFVDYIGLNVKSTAENCIATGNILRFGIFPEEWPAASTCKRIIACTFAFPPTLAATVSDASQAFFLMRTVGNKLDFFPGLTWDITGGILAFATGWTTFFTKGLETGHAVSSLLGKTERHPNCLVQFSMDTLSCLIGSGALIHETAMTFYGLMSICDSLSLSTDEAKYPLIVIALSNGIATACYQKAFFTTELQKAYGCFEKREFNWKKGILLFLASSLSLLTFLEMPYNKITYQSSLESFDIYEESWGEPLTQSIGIYVTSSMFLIGIAALYGPLSEIGGAVANKLNFSTWYQLTCSLLNYVKSIYTAYCTSPAYDEAKVSLLAEDDNVIEDEEEAALTSLSESIQGSIQSDTRNSPSPYIAQNLFHMRSIPSSKQNQAAKQQVMRCGLF